MQGRIIAIYDEGDHFVEWWFLPETSQHLIVYGEQLNYYDDSVTASENFGLCVLHSAECLGLFTED